MERAATEIGDVRQQLSDAITAELIARDEAAGLRAELDARRQWGLRRRLRWGPGGGDGSTRCVVALVARWPSPQLERREDRTPVGHREAPAGAAPGVMSWCAMAGAQPATGFGACGDAAPAPKVGVHVKLGRP